MKTCGYCGNDNTDEVSHCHECGTQDFRQDAKPIIPPELPSKLVAVPRDPKSRGAFETAIPQVSLGGWTVWLLLGLVLVAVERPKFTSLMSIAPFIGAFGGKAGGILLSALLIQRPSRRMALLLGVLSLWACWKFFLGEIVLYTHSELGGLTFHDSVQAWWQRSTSSALRVATLPFCLFTILSVFTWPIYALFFGGTVVRQVGGSKNP